VELGYTHEFHASGANIQLSPLWPNGFEIFNGKVNLLPENYKKMNWFPAISTGFIARTNVRDVGNYMVQVHSAAIKGKTNESPTTRKRLCCVCEAPCLPDT
jgi:hypothetical protein